MIKKILLIFFIIFITYLIFTLFYRPKTKAITISLGNTKYNFEIAKTIKQKALGLSKRTSLCQNCGMIFIYQSEGIYPFWMKNTLIPLDMVWLDKNGVIVAYHNAQPQLKTPLTQLKIYQNNIPAKYIVELNSGDYNKLGLKTGDIINLSNLND